MELRNAKAYELPSQHVQEHALHDELGDALTQFGSPRSISPVGVLAINIGGVMAGLATMYMQLLLTLLLTWQAVLVLLVGLGWIVAGGWLLRTSLTQRKMVVIHEGGMICMEKKRCEVIRWQEMVAIWSTPPQTASPSRYRVERIDRYSFEFDETLPRAEQLKHLLEREILCRLFAHCLDQYRQNYRVAFGPVSLNQYGVRVAPLKRFLPWHELKYIDEYNGVVYIRQKQQRNTLMSIPLSSIPNSCVLKCLVRHIHRVHQEAQRQRVMLIPKRPHPLSSRSTVWQENTQKRKEVLRTLKEPFYV